MTAFTETKPASQPITGQVWVAFGLIVTLLALRYMVTAFRLVFAEPPDWVLPTFEIGTYILVAILLVRESERLTDYHISPLALWIMILFKPFETIYQSIIAKQVAPMKFPMAFPSPISLVVWVIALGLLVYFRSRLFQKEAVRWQELKWALLGCLVAIASALVTSYPESFEIPPLDPKVWTVARTLSENRAFFLSILYNIGLAAVSEEPVFRGFLWGFLHKNGWREIWVWLFQAGLFTLAHLYYVKNLPIMFWFCVPLGALVLGWLAWRSRSIATSMVAHGVMNGLSYPMAFLVAVLRL